MAINTFQKHPRTGMYYLTVPATIAKKFSTEKRVICKIGTITFHCALQYSKDLGYFVYIGKENQKRIQAAGASGKVVFAKDTSIHQFKMPPELKEVLDPISRLRKFFSPLHWW
jgi:hypothetical protein